MFEFEHSLAIVIMRQLKKYKHIRKIFLEVNDDVNTNALKAIFKAKYNVDVEFKKKDKVKIISIEVED